MKILKFLEIQLKYKALFTDLRVIAFSGFPFERKYKYCI